ncbi:CLUMA_CG004039, isoform A [Clunio marinus]|uniref:CLUMA_CG004039, isoform A n=1 Tax=Clunio marinus TaxID=568069 RepID=A0A1J1HQE1_9DIPT|nr:CLUMA_CG004039, isoform A [Clunio marinus]
MKSEVIRKGRNGNYLGKSRGKSDSYHRRNSSQKNELQSKTIHNTMLMLLKLQNLTLYGFGTVTRVRNDHQ